MVSYIMATTDNKKPSATGFGSAVGSSIFEHINKVQQTNTPKVQGQFNDKMPSPLLPSGYDSYNEYQNRIKNGGSPFGTSQVLASNRSSDATAISSSTSRFDKHNPLSNAGELQSKYKIKEDEIVELNLGKYNNSKFIPQHLTKTLIGKAAGYALTKGDYFGAITFLCEGVYPKAFYYDPATGGTRGTLVNTHPGITLSLQPDNTIRGIFVNTSLRHMTEEIVDKAKYNRGISSNMANARLQVSDYYHMFQKIEGKYSQGAYKALEGRLAGHPLAKPLLAKGMSKAEVMEQMQSELSPASYSVLQQLAYKYGNGGIKRFGKLLDATISAGLDPDNQEKHLAQGAKHIVYQYMNSKKQWIQDTRVMNIHRLFFLSGEKFSPELNLKLITGSKLDKSEEELVSKVAKKAGVPNIIKDGRLDLPDGTIDTVKQANPPKLNTAAINKGVTTVNQNFKPIDAEPPKPKIETPKVDIDDTPRSEAIKPKALKAESPSAAPACMVAACVVRRHMNN